MSITVEQLLATLGIDQAGVEVSTSGRYVLIQRDPQPDETRIAIDTEVIFTLVDLDGDPTDASLVPPDFDLTIEGETAMTYVAGVETWFAPWTGLLTAYQSSSPYVFWNVAAQQSGGPFFESEQVVNVEVGISSPESILFLYQFQIVDLTPPRFVSAEATDPFTIRLTFDDDMMLSGSGSVLDIANWANAFARLNVDPMPGVNLAAVSLAASDVATLSVPTTWTYVDESSRLAAIGFVEGDVGKLAFQSSDSTYWMLTGYSPIRWTDLTPASQFDLRVNWEMTPDCRYRLTAGAAIEDESGNAIDSAFSSAYFTGFGPAVPVGRTFDYWKNIVPQKNKTEDATRDLERFANCINEVLGWMLYYVDHFVDQWDPDLANDLQIDAMLYDMGNPFASWVDLELAPIQKRKLLRILVDIYGSKGTAWGIEQTVYFLLGEIVHVVDYLASEGWILDVDELGSGGIAEVMSQGWEPWDFTSLAKPWELTFRLRGVSQTVTLVASDFADETDAKAAEVAAAVTARATGAGAYAAIPGQSATVLGTNVEPFAISPGDLLQITFHGEIVPRDVMFRTEDIAVSGAATAAEIASRISADLFGIMVARDESGAVMAETIRRGELASIQVQASATQTALGFSTALIEGTDHAQVVIYSTDASKEASIQVTGGIANSLVDFDTEEIGYVGGTILGPDDSFIKYSFDIETENVLTSEQENIVRKVAEYMRPAHTHLISIRTVLPLPWPDGWVLGVSELEVTTELLE